MRVVYHYAILSSFLAFQC